MHYYLLSDYNFLSEKKPFYDYCIMMQFILVNAIFVKKSAIKINLIIRILQLSIMNVQYEFFC